jgi:asparagine synthase (glutamine-hydrolysing)
MCGVSAVLQIDCSKVAGIASKLQVMNTLQRHRGPDDEGTWIAPRQHVGFGHRRLSIIDISDAGHQPMTDGTGLVVTYNGEIYNYIELRKELGENSFRSTSDTEVILHAYRKWGTECVQHFRGMFAFCIWDESQQQLFCARDRFGMKPLYYAVVDGVLYCASEAKALLPFLPAIETDAGALKDYLVFQLCLEGKTLFKGLKELLPGHTLIVKSGNVRVARYWEIYYRLDFDHTRKYFEERLRALLEDSIHVHTRSDVPIGAYLSGGIDSGIVASVAVKYQKPSEFPAFTGKFSNGALYDESMYARAISERNGQGLIEKDITSRDFIESIRKVIYHLDYPVAGPGSFPQYQVSKVASQHRKVVLGGQGGDEIFGGYVRYLIAYFEQCIKGAIDGTLHNGNFVVTYESIIPNLVAFQNYKPLLKQFFREGLFDDISSRYYGLISRAPDLADEIKWEQLDNSYSPFETYKAIFNGENVGKESYFDKMTHFDFKTLLPALLQVEDRMSMAHGLESRLPFLDHALVEFVATMPSDIKFKDGTLKKVLIDSMRTELPDIVANRKNKMGFPVPLNEWVDNGELHDFIMDIFHSANAKNRPYFNAASIEKILVTNSKFGRKLWGLLSLELWQEEFHDKENEYKKLLTNMEVSA